MQEHLDRIRDEFQKQARGFANPQLTMNQEGYLQWILDSLTLSKSMTVLDVAAGTGILSRAIAPHVLQVVSADLSDDMIREGIRLNTEHKLDNIVYRQTDAASLPFADGAFDLVVSRFAFHHFVDPGAVLDEMVRVCKPQGRVGVIDMSGPEDPVQYEGYNHYERLRDPSHTYALRHSYLTELFQERQLGPERADLLDVPVHVQRWMNLTQPAPEVRDQIERELREDLASPERQTGMRPYEQSGELKFMQQWSKIIGIKPQQRAVRQL
ncbi:class I SAM-dependent methyltransferase [Paenibacillus sp. 1P07SE]|uniref:class I SAM-dependent methyltransferase n=1 Tax=Paenibacillus sp. 1P07SE TaxID=3132209 RepID=UPI0039A63A19